MTPHRGELNQIKDWKQECWRVNTKTLTHELWSRANHVFREVIEKYQDMVWGVEHSEEMGE